MNDQTINERFRIIRKHVQLSQKEFGAPMGMTIDEVKNVEYGKTTIRADKIPLLCNAYGIRKEWLLNGELPMEASKSVNFEIGKIAANAAQNKPEEAKAYFEKLYERLGEANFLLLYEVVKNILPLEEPANADAQDGE